MVRQITMLIANIKSKITSFLNASSETADDESFSSPTIIAKSLNVTGELVSSGTIEIEGTVNGNIKSNSVVIREGGFVDGTIIADYLHIRGRFNGAIKAKNIAIAETAEIVGNIEYESISVEDGASLDAQFKIIAA